MESEVLKEKIHTEPMLNDPRYITLLSLVVLIVTLLFWWCFSRRRQQRRSVLLTGLSDSGKTLLFVRLAYSQYRQTFTSMKENVEDYITSNTALRIVDLPGQERLRNKFYDQYKASAKAIVYVVDSVTIQKEIRDVAEYLYTILADPTVQSYSPSVLILCNKQDQPLAKGSQVIKSLLEKEINLVRVTKSSQLQSVDPSQSNKTTFLGKMGKDFEFSHLNCRVDIAECSANTGDDDNPADIKSLQEWILKL
ncbi:signal recognition particle receptor subunit beta [Hyposmocoma kahamanoa]|uniref:signal recognition particle receptor subunit beta n=1 Tax=Hyposmocoma kahamanoa TaxID=1477025 RepID=UPI000E6D7716|nr:signal recognition particle receptor subunit beta [Hyposmocoma kahamanoa]